MESIDPSEAALFISEVNVELYIEFSMVALLIYDTFTTMDNEVKYFWSQPRKFVSLIYFMNRYIGILSAVSAIAFNTPRSNVPLCLFSFWTRAITDLVTILLIDYILQMRVMALFSDDRRVSIILKTIFFMEAAAGLALLVSGNIHEEVGVASLTEEMIFCVVNRLPSPIWAPISWSIPLAYGLILMVMAFYKAAEFWRLSAGFKGFTLVKILLQDQVMYFSIVLFCSVIQIIANTTLLSESLSIAFSAMGNPSVLCVLGSRILVHLKEAGERGANGGTSYKLRTMSEMEFC